MGLNETDGRKTIFSNVCFQKPTADSTPQLIRTAQRAHEVYVDSSSVVVAFLAHGRFKAKSEAIKSEPQISFILTSTSLLNDFPLSSYPDKVRGTMFISSLFIFVVHSL